jgi:hypothetical protein
LWVVDYKSTVVVNGLSPLLLSMLTEHLVRQIPRLDGKISSSPQVPAPKGLPQVRKLLKECTPSKNHLTNIFDNLGLSNRLKLVLFAIQHKLRGTARSKQPSQRTR